MDVDCGEDKETKEPEKGQSFILGSLPTTSLSYSKEYPRTVASGEIGEKIEEDGVKTESADGG